MNEIIPAGPPAFILWSYSIMLCGALLASLSILVAMSPDSRRFATDPLPGKRATRLLTPLVLVGVSASLAFIGNLLLFLKIVLQLTNPVLDVTILSILYLSGVCIIYFIPRVIAYILRDQLAHSLGSSA